MFQPVYIHQNKPIVNILRQKGILVVLYLDDFLFIHKSKLQCEENMKLGITLLEHLGFIVNYEKSFLIAKQTCKYLGFIIDSLNFSLNLTEKKKNQIINLIGEFTIGKSYKIRKFAEFLRILTSACPAVAYGFIHCKRLEQQKFLALKFNGGNYEGRMIIVQSMVEDLIWWKLHAAIGSHPIEHSSL